MRLGIVLPLVLLAGPAPESEDIAPLASPERSRRHRYSASLDLGFAQFRDELNSGLVYHGAPIGTRFGYTHDLDPVRLRWSVGAQFGFFGSHGLAALVPQLDWLDVSVLFPIRRRRVTMWLGPGLDSDLRWYVNPLLHSGHFFWYGHYDLEMRGGTDFSLRDQPFRASLRINALSLASRPSANPDPYFYDWRFTDLFGRTHRDMRLGSLDTIRHVELGLEWIAPRRKHDFGLAYAFRYEDYTRAPALRSVQHLVRLTWHQR